MFELRYYQREAVQSVRDYWNDGGGNPLIEMATGCGKSVVIANLSRQLLEEFPGLRILQLVHVRELVQQNAMALMRMWPSAPIGINSASLGRRDKHSQILFASIQSVYRSAAQLGPRDVVMVDEAHLIPRDGQGMYRTLLSKLRDSVPDLRVAGFTATGYRLDSGRLDEGDGRIFDDVVYSYDLARGVEDGFLSPLVAKATATEIDTSGVARRGGEFASGALEAAADKDDVVQGACNEIVEFGRDRKSWLAFCSGISHSFHVRDALRERGISCETVTGETPSGERDQIIKAFRAGSIKCLTNAMVLTTGFDVPQVDMIAMLRPTLSTGLYVQILGRGTRLADGKTNCLVLDFAGNVRRHGPVDAVVVTTSKKKDGDRKSEKADPDAVNAKICPACQTYNALSTLECVSCGFQWPKPEPKHSAVAESAPVMTREIVNKWINVTDVRLDRHRKPEGTDSLVVEYQCGLQSYREWVCVEHPLGLARTKSEHWWRAMGGRTPYPRGIDDALSRAGELAIATAITIIRDGKFWKITGYRLERDGVVFEVDSNFRSKMVELA